MLQRVHALHCLEISERCPSPSEKDRMSCWVVVGLTLLSAPSPVVGGKSWDAVRECLALRTLWDRDLGKIAGGYLAEGGTDAAYKALPQILISQLSCEMGFCAWTALCP